MSQKHTLLGVAAAALAAALLAPVAHPQNDRSVPPPERAEAAPGAPREPIVIDDFSDPARWMVVASDGVRGKLSRVEVADPDGGAPANARHALRMDFDFQRGSGYCIVRREFDPPLPLPTNYRIGFHLSGASATPATGDTARGFINDLEFKLYDQTGDNVWWVRTPDFHYEPSWSVLRYVKRQLDFAWGPGAGRVPLERVRAIEFAVTSSAAGAASGVAGAGHILLRELRLEPLGVSSLPEGSAMLRVNGGADREMQGGEARDLLLRADDAGKCTLHVDFRGPAPFGGFGIEWVAGDARAHATGEISLDGTIFEPWITPRTKRHGDPLLLPYRGAEASKVKLTFDLQGAKERTVRRLFLLPRDAGSNPNAARRVIARMSPRGWYPRQFLEEQVTWSVFGAPGSEFEGLLSGDGAVEISKFGRTVEPMLWMDDRLWTWADFEGSFSLAQGRLPLPRTHLKVGDTGLTIDVEPCVIRENDADGVAVRYRVNNRSDAARSGRLLLALRSFQVLPAWHTLNGSGGVSAASPGQVAVGVASKEKATISVGADHLASCTGAAAVEPLGGEHDIVEQLAHGHFDAAPGARGAAPLDSAAMVLDFGLEPGQSRSFWVRAQSGGVPPSVPAPEALDRAAEQVTASWRERLSRVAIDLPPIAQDLEDTFAAQIGWILVNMDGPAIQPGSRTYDRTWIRDGALTATALLYTGHHEEVRAFLDWFKDFQYDDGKIPCCVDARGPDPVPEHDSHGQYIYAVAAYHRFTGDDDLLRRHWPRIVKTVAYIESLRAQRMTDRYAGGPPEERAKYGLVPESISHEGYSAKPMHSYWDNFFVLRGLKDAVYAAETLGESETAARWAVLVADFRRTLVDSIALAMRNKSIDYIPGCVELGDFDATSTAVAVFPCDEVDALPPEAVAETFEKYWEFFTSRRDGTREWKDYTPYENRLISAALMLGNPRRAHELMAWFMADRNPPGGGWRQWGEIVWKDKTAPRFVGDLPHTWVGSDFLKAVRNLCVHERGRDRALVIGAGLPREWVETPEGVRVANLATEFGPVSFTLRGDRPSGGPSRWALRLEAGTRTPPGGLWFVPMLEGRTIRSATVNGVAVDARGDARVRIGTLPAEVVIEIE